MRIVTIQRKFLLIGLGIFLFILGFCLNKELSLPTASISPKAEVAIVIDDFGGYAAGIKEMMALPYHLTFAILPFEEFSSKQAEEAATKGYEVIVHMPFQAYRADPRWYGKKYISTNTEETEIRQIIDESFQILPMADGLNNHMGSKATADFRVMDVVFDELTARGRFFLDSKTGANSALTSLASVNKLPFIERDLFLDEKATPEHMRNKLKQLMLMARTKGAAVGIGHVGPSGPVLAAVLREELPKYQKEGYQFVLLSKLVLGDSPVKGKNKKIIIGIDPGHGGIDSGACWGSIVEKNINLKFSQKLALELEKRGYGTVLTREKDQLLTPYADYKYKKHPYKRDDFDRRIQKLNMAGVAMVISVHANWNKSALYRGPIVYYGKHSTIPLNLARNIQNHLNLVQSFRKVPKPITCYLLKQMKAPAVLLELGFLSNPQDRVLLEDETYQRKLISAIITGIEQSLSM